MCVWWKGRGDLGQVVCVFTGTLGAWKSTARVLTRGLVLSEFVQLAPCPVGLLPNDDFAVIRTRSKDATKLRMGPVQLPHWPLMPAAEEREDYSSTWKEGRRLVYQ